MVEDEDENTREVRTHHSWKSKFWVLLFDANRWQNEWKITRSEQHLLWLRFEYKNEWQSQPVTSFMFLSSTQKSKHESDCTGRRQVKRATTFLSSTDCFDETFSSVWRCNSVICWSLNSWTVLNSRCKWITETTQNQSSSRKNTLETVKRTCDRQSFTQRKD